MTDRILIIDIETTGFLTSGGHIVEIGIVELDLQTGDKAVKFNSMCQEPGMTEEEVRTSWIVQNGWITPEEILGAPMLQDIRQQVQDIINQYPAGATAFNNKFDFDFLEDRGIQIPKALHCPMLISTNICKLPGKYGYKWPKAEEAYRHFYPERPYTEIHRGADDAWHEADIVLALYRMGKFTINR